MAEFTSKHKDPDAKLDYTFDWKVKGWLLSGDTIIASEWIINPDDLLTNDKSLIAISEFGSLATFTTITVHEFSVGKKVRILGVTPSGYNGTWIIGTTPTTTTFTATLDVSGLSPGTVFGSAQSPPELEKVMESFTVERATIWLKGGVAGEDYEVTNRITTSQGRIDDRTVLIPVRER